MAAISAKAVQELRTQTGLPMMECKKALTESNGDIDAAVEYLKKVGSAKIEKMASRETSQGRVAAYVSDDRTRGGIIALLCETAPVANTDDFINICKAAAEATAALPEASPEAVMASQTSSGRTVQDIKDEAFNRLRENMNLRDVASLHGHVASYVHHNAQNGVLVLFSRPCPEELASGVCMHIAALDPKYLRREEVDAALVAEERERVAGEAAGKPPEIAQKMVEGKLNRWYSEIVLLEQPFVKDDKVSVQGALHAADKELTIERFVRLQI